MINFIPKATFKIFLLSFCMYVAFFFAGESNAGISAEKAKWKNDATSAYSMIHDDACDYGKEGVFATAIPMANERNLVLGLGVIVGQCVDKASWIPNYWQDSVVAFANQGHEIINHTYTHPEPPLSNLDKEIKASHDTIKAHIENYDMIFFIYPKDQSDGTSLNYLSNLGYIGARTGDRDINIHSESFNPMYSNYRVLDNNTSILRQNIDAGISGGGWALQEMHEVGNNGTWGAITPENYETFLDYVEEKVEANQVWMGTPSNVIKYMKTYYQCGDVSVSNDEVISFSNGGSVEDKYAIEITVMLDFNPGPTDEIHVLQNDEELEVEEISSTEYYVQINPALGDAIIHEGTGTIVASFDNLKKNVRFNNGNVITFLPIGKYKIQMFTIDGKKVSRSISGYSNGEKVRAFFDTNRLSSGFYLLYIQFNGGSVTNKVLISH